MKVTQVAICPSEASRQAGRPALTPELLAASGARYSRNNEGLQEILSKIDPVNLDKSVDSIFRMIDYGHQSIADMVPVAMFIDGISLWLAYYVWTLCPTAGGQESSTRYIRIGPSSLISADKLGVAPEQVDGWNELMTACTNAYQESILLWESVARQNPRLMGIPQDLINDPSESAQKKVSRMRRNYAFDRARYFLPVAAATNSMLVMSARGWVNLCQHLLSHPLPEPQLLGERVRDELKLSAPRLLKHATVRFTNQKATAEEFQAVARKAKAQVQAWENTLADQSNERIPHLSVMLPEDVAESDLASALACHENRYSPFGSALQRVAVRFGWASMTFAEIRDLNRHRTGTKYSPQLPSGFYFAADQLPDWAAKERAQMLELADIGRKTTAHSLNHLRNGNPAYIYFTLLGTEFPFEHTTTADKFIYEAELRTGVGAHFRYAKHFRDVLALWYKRFPATKKWILEGNAEPE